MTLFTILMNIALSILNYALWSASTGDAFFNLWVSGFCGGIGFSIMASALARR